MFESKYELTAGWGGWVMNIPDSRVSTVMRCKGRSKEISVSGRQYDTDWPLLNCGQTLRKIFGGGKLYVKFLVRGLKEVSIRWIEMIPTAL